MKSLGFTKGETFFICTNIFGGNKIQHVYHPREDKAAREMDQTFPADDLISVK